jgi:hypothetical protein
VGLEIAKISFKEPAGMKGIGKAGVCGSRLATAGFIILALAVAESARAQAPNPSSSLLSPAQQSPLAINPQSVSPGTSLVNPSGDITGTAPLLQSPLGAQTGLIVPAGQLALAVNARYGKELPPINGALYWRVYADKPVQGGQFRLVKEDQAASPTFMLPPGGYIVHVNFGLANAVKHVQLRAANLREIFEIPAGGARFEGRVGEFRVPAGQISFDLFKGSQFDPGDKQAIAQQIQSGDVVLLPEGVYHVVSNYGDSNAVVRSDLRIQAAKLTDTVIVHRAAKITLKLVNDRGGEAVANTAWSVLTPGGDVIKESIGAFPVVILAEGDYIAIARSEGKVFNREFKVESGIDREIEVLAR